MDSDLAPSTEALIDLALAEDLGENGDITSRSFVPEEHQSRGVIVARESAVLAGVEIAAAVFQKIDLALELAIGKSNGSALVPNDIVMTIIGSTRSILTAERTALNFLQRLSGVATLTRAFVTRATEATPAVEILDTRKTTPGWRGLEKAAVVAGGGRNHRMGLYDAAMVKDNHLVAENSEAALKAGIAAIREQFPKAFIELEADRLDQVRRFLAMDDVDVILLDNMDCDQLREAVALRNELAPGIKLEASGGVNLDTVAAIAATGVDCISVGALTHSARAADLALDLESLESDA
jgi:nicotinate-nucleotide pyrophosphorylase (carboxylating)